MEGKSKTNNIGDTSDIPPINYIFFSMERFNSEAYKKARANFSATRQIPRDRPYQWLNAEHQPRPDQHISGPLLASLTNATSDMPIREQIDRAAAFYNSPTPIQLESSNPQPPMAIFPGGAPIVDHLAFLSTFPDAWPCFPPSLFRDIRLQRGFPFNALPSMGYRQITIGVSPPDVIENTAAWLQDKLKLSQTKFGVKWAPVVMTAIETTYSELEAILTLEPGDVFPLTGQLHDDWQPNVTLFPSGRTTSSCSRWQ